MRAAVTAAGDSWQAVDQGQHLPRMAGELGVEPMISANGFRSVDGGLEAGGRDDEDISSTRRVSSPTIVAHTSQRRGRNPSGLAGRA